MLVRSFKAYCGIKFLLFFSNNLETTLSLECYLKQAHKIYLKAKNPSVSFVLSLLYWFLLFCWKYNLVLKKGWIQTIVFIILFFFCPENLKHDLEYSQHTNKPMSTGCGPWKTMYWKDSVSSWNKQEYFAVHLLSFC